MKKYVWIFGLLVSVSSCVAPRAITNSGKVTPKGNWVVATNQTYNIATAPAEKVASALDVNLDNLLTGAIDTFSIAESNVVSTDWQKVGEALMANNFDPIGGGFEFGVRYGIAERFDVGFKKTGRAKAIDVQYQFLGSLGNVDDFSESTTDKWYGSIGLQYSSQDISLPFWARPINSRLQYDFSRKDILVPLIFSYGLGNEESIGAISFGLAYNFTRMQYSTTPFTYAYIQDANGVVTALNSKAITETKNINSFGAFANMKIGFRYFYFVPAVAVYYQNYGTLQNFVGESFQMKGVTVVPSLGLR
ncbi:MAG: hypothetical protein ACOVMJ_10980, partial [Flavobacteriales bacterium]